VSTPIGENLSVASSEAEKNFMGLGAAETKYYGIPV